MPLPTSAAIFAIDPGGTTGVARAVVDLRQLTVQRAMRRARAKRNLQTWNVKGSHEEQAFALAQGVVDFLFYTHVERSLVEYHNFYIVIEGFRIQQMGADLSPVQVASGLETLLFGAMKDRWGSEDFYQKQFASEAKGFCTDKMLDKWGLLKGKTPHERDALRHLARRVDKLLKGE